MQKDKLDEIREKLRLDSLEDNIKKDMFNKFVQAGGQVVDINKKSKKSHSKSDFSREHPEKNQVLKARRHHKDIPPPEWKRKRRETFNIIDPKDNPINKWIERFSARLGCVFSGILSFNGDSFKNSFRDLVLNQYQNVLLNSRMILASILYQDKLVANEIKKSFFMDTIFPYNYELIYRFDNLYTNELFDKLSILRHSLQLVKEIKPLLIQIFKSILVIQPYYVYLKTAVEKALIAEKNIRRFDPSITYDNLKKIYSFIDFVFLKLYPRLFTVIDWYYKTDALVKEESFKDFLKFYDEDVIGYYTNKWKEELAAAAKKDGDKSKDAERSLLSASGESQPPGFIQMDDNDPIKKGLRIIEKNLKLNDILNGYTEQKDIRSLFSIKDRVFVTYCLIDFFDKEFSYIFTSNKVKLNIGFLEGKRSDMKRELSDTYYKLNNMLERVNEYLKIIKEIKKLENDSFVSLQERSSRSNQYSLQRSQVSRTMRKDAKEFFEEFSQKLLFLLSDYQTHRKIIENPDAVIVFDKKIDGERLTNGKKVIESVEEAYCFSSAAYFLLTDGDLSSFGLIIEKPIYIHLDFEQNNDTITQ